MAIFYFTFPASSSMANAYMPIEADSLDAAQDIMNDMYPDSFWLIAHKEMPAPTRRSTASSLYPVPFGYMPESI